MKAKTRYLSLEQIRFDIKKICPRPWQVLYLKEYFLYKRHTWNEFMIREAGLKLYKSICLN